MNQQPKGSQGEAPKPEKPSMKSRESVGSARLPEAIDEWRKIRKSRQCQDYSDMYYWQVVSTCPAL